MGKQGICIYCLKTVDNITKDHIPPKSITPKIYKEQFKTVPACLECNNKLSLEDEYFKMTILLNENICNQERLQEITSKLLNRFNHPSYFWDNFLSKIERVDFYTPDEKYLGRKLRYKADYSRIADFFVRLAKGIYYLETGKYIPVDYVNMSVDLGDTFPEQQLKIIEMMYIAIKDLDFKERTEIIKFRYKLYPENHRLHSVWNIIMYDELKFLISFSNKNKIDFTTNAYDYIVKGT